MVKRTTALARICQQESAVSIAENLGCSVSGIYEWLKKRVYEGVDGLKINRRGGGLANSQNPESPFV